mgnify:CR=1 FL=1
MTATDRWIADNEFDPKYPLWTRANAGEVLPAPPSPLGWELVFEGGAILGWRDSMINRLGIEAHEVDDTRPQVMGIFGGYTYLGATILRVWAERTPGFSAEMLDAAYFAGHPDVPAYVAEPWHENQHTTDVMTQWLGWVMADMNQDELEADRLDAHRIRAERPDLSTSTDAELLARAFELKPVCRRLFDQHINQSGAAGIGPGVIGAVCAAIGQPEAAMRLMAGVGGVDSAAPSYAMWELSRTVKASQTLTELFDAAGDSGIYARLQASDHADAQAFLAQLDEFLVEYGSRGANEWDIHAATWETTPDLALVLIAAMRAADQDGSPVTENTSRAAEREQLSAQIAEALAADPEAQGQFQAALASSATFMAGRERSKTNIIRVIGEVRMAIWEIGRRAVERGELDEPADVCLLFADEMEQLVAGELADVRAIATARKAHHEFLAEREPPFIFSDAPPPPSEWPLRGGTTAPTLAVGETITGLAGCAGIARGRAVIVDHPSDPGDLGPGDILIAPMTDPAWTPLFVPAEGVVVNVGAPLSHAIIVSRELGIPCVVSANDATERIPNGALVEVNGDTGVVTLLELP